jgi:hypothetical protein
MDLSELCHLVRFVRRSDKSKEMWLEAPTLTYCSLTIVEELLQKAYIVYYMSFEEDPCIKALFEDQ